MTEPAGTPDAQPLVSVLTPAYNGARYIAEAIESVIAQTYQNWRMVVVDNMSTDATLEVAREVAARDDRVEIVSSDEFVPVIQNWNRAAAHAHPGAAYLKMVHADDWLYPECIARMVAVGEAHPSVGLIGAYRLDDLEVNLDGLPPEVEVVDGRELAKHLLLGNLPYLFGAPSSSLIRAGAVHRDPIYDEAYLHADYEIGFQILRDSDFGFVHQVLSYTRRHDAAVTPFAVRNGTYRPEQIQALRQHGPHFLSPADYERRLAVLLVLYGKFLATRPTRLRSEEWRSYHRERVARSVRGVPAPQLARGVGRQLARIARGERTYHWRPGADG